ncbi:hypothetical protein ONZ45_g7202 [Pleurotus djamor]|nr:hypothetical protein ONZ45_g7202 [Pleurotus djamor]
MSFDLPPPNPIPAKLTMPFLDVLATVSVSERFGSPSLSPVGSLVAPVAGGVLGAIAGAVEHPSLIDCTALGVAERAMLAEVSLQAILVGLFEPSRTTPPDDPIINIVLADMEKQYLDNPINLAGFASTLSPWLMNYGLDIAEFKFARMLESPRRRTIRDPIVLGRERKPLNGLPSSQENVNKHPAFVEGLLEATLPVVHADEGAFDFLGPLIMKAGNATTTLQTLSSDPVWDALTNFRWNLLDLLAAGSNVYTGHLTPNARLTSIIRFQRALSADQALSALMKLPRDKLDQLKVKRITGGRMREEGILDFIKSTLQTMGPYPLEVARRAVEQLTPFIHKKNSRRKTSTDVD